MLFMNIRIDDKINVEYKHDSELFYVELANGIRFYLNKDEMKHFHYEVESALYQAYQEEGADK